MGKGKNLLPITLALRYPAPCHRPSQTIHGLALMMGILPITLRAAYRRCRLAILPNGHELHSLAPSPFTHLHHHPLRLQGDGFHSTGQLGDIGGQFFIIGLIGIKGEMSNAGNLLQ